MKLEPRQPGGVKDYLPSEMIPRQRLIDKTRNVFESFGFDPLDTPGIELKDTLTGGKEDFGMIIYTAKPWGRGVEDIGDDKGEKALRFDLTVPLARVVAAYPQLPKPFKRYQIGTVWRGERPQRGRYREFMQFDADIVGASSAQADAEIICLICATLSALDVGPFVVKVNNRKVLNGLSVLVGYPSSSSPQVLRILDKMDKIGRDGVYRELQASRTNDARSPELTREQVERLFEFIDLSGDANKERLRSARVLFSDIPTAIEGLSELEEIRASVEAYGISDDNWTIDFSIARGLGYYTGPVFEAVLVDMPKIGSVFSGGRYDGLVNQFSERVVPATGASIGIDRLFAALTALDRIAPQATMAQVFVPAPDKTMFVQYNRIASLLRRAGIRTNVYVGEEEGMGKQLKEAAQLGIPFAVIADPADTEIVTLRDLKTRSDRKLPIGEVIAAVLGAGNEKAL